MFKIVDAGLKMVVLNPCNEDTVAMTIMTTVCLLFVFSSSIFFCLFDRTNLVKNYIALVLAAFMNAGLFEVF